MENKKFSYKSIYTIYIIIVFIILGYFVGWYITGKKYKNYAIKKIKDIPSLSYKKISLNGFPFKFGLKFVDLQFSSSNYGTDIKFITKSIQLSKALFNNIVRIDLDNIRYETNKDRIIEIILKKGNSLNLKFDNKAVVSINMIIPSLIISDSYKKNEEIIVENIIYKTEEIKNDSYINKPNYLDIEKILTYEYDDKIKTLKNESNFSLDLSSINIIDNENILSKGLDLNKITYNNITKNYSFNIKGEYKESSETMFSLSFDIDINNYDNFTESLQDPIKIDTIKNLSNSIPNIVDNINKDKHITVKKSVDSDTITINGKSLNDIMNDVLKSIK